MRTPLAIAIAMALSGPVTTQAADLNLPSAMDRALRLARQKAVAPNVLQERALRHYHDALIADLEYQAAAENIAMDYYALGQRQKAGDASIDGEIAIKAAEIRYQASLERRLTAATHQRLAREALKQELELERPPGDLADAPPSVVPADLPATEDLVATMLANNREWAAAASRRLDKNGKRALQQSLELRLLEARLEVDRLARGSMRRVAAETEHAELLLEKSREDLAEGRKGDIGHAMARTSDIRVRKAHVEADLATAILRLEHLLGISLRDLRKP